MGSTVLRGFLTSGTTGGRVLRREPGAMVGDVVSAACAADGFGSVGSDGGALGAGGVVPRGGLGMALETCLDDTGGVWCTAACAAA